MPRPNVLFVMVDDLGWGDVSCHGAPFETPTIDRTFDRGLELREHYVCPMCTPTRASLMTGRYPSRFGRHATEPSNEPVLPDGYPTIATMFSEAGYDTGLFGKWHLGSDPAYGPQEFGFDHAYGSLAGGVDPYTHRYKPGEYSETWHRNGERVDERGHVTDLLADEACAWIADRSDPWFAYVPFTAVHTPIKDTEAWYDEYEDEHFYNDEALDRGRKRYAAYASHLDSAFGRILETLKEGGELSNTLVVFTSDNGASESIGEAPYPGWQWGTPGIGSNHPFTGQKCELYEGGIRTPTAVMWPGEIESGSLEQPLSIADWMPTLAELIGCSYPRSEDWDGIDIWPQLAGTADGDLDRTLYWNFRGEHFALRDGDWKLITDAERDRLELYDIRQNPYTEMALLDKSEEEPAIVSDLLEQIEAERAVDGRSERADV